MTTTTGCACGDCQGPRDRTPVRIDNLPGLPAIGYRTGTHTRFKASMLARLAAPGVLARLRTRDDDDFSVALLDAWATLADVLSFYQERIANEGYLRTATERRSVLELARAIGYEPRPGTAAGATLAFTLDAAPGAPTRITIPSGVAVRSLPDPGETAQMFETVEAVEARVAWNALRPALTRRHPLPPPGNRLAFAGIDTNLKTGDGVYFRPQGATANGVFGVITGVLPQPEQPPDGARPRRPARTLVTYQPLGPKALYDSRPGLETQPPAAPLGELARRYLRLPQPIQAADLELEAASNHFQVQDLFDNLAASPDPPPSVMVFRTRAAIHGHNAPDWPMLPFVVRKWEFVNDFDNKGKIIQRLLKTPLLDLEHEWVDQALRLHVAARKDLPGTLYLDNVHPAITAGSFVVLQDAESSTEPKWALHRVLAATDLSRSAYTLTAKLTRLTLDTSTSDQTFASLVIRNTVVFGQSELLPLARVDDDSDVATQEVELDGFVDGLTVGRTVVLSGESAATTGLRASEVTTLAKVEHHLERGGATTITLADSPRDHYRRLTVSINANAAFATHGETRQEILGSGDAGQAFQRFTLRQSPLTYLSAQNASGVASTLEVFVNDLRWQEVPSLLGHGPDEHVYVTRLDDDGTTTVQFGDGRTGARLPSGVENVRAVYRKGSGLAGRVKAGQLSMPVVRPPGVTAVTNPRPATGGSDPEVLADAAANAPLTVLTLDRIVSLHDYEAFARAFAGVAKALAVWTRSGGRRGVFVTVAGPGGAGIDPADEVHKHLLAAMRQAGDPFVPLRLASFQPRFFRVAADLKLDPAYQASLVRAAVERALRAAFGFDARAFGQPVAQSEVIAVIHGVPGVTAARLTEFHPSERTGGVEPVVEAVAPQAGALADVEPAELRMLDPQPLQLGSLP
jgi:predicted phage baseplate assembly protein